MTDESVDPKVVRRLKHRLEELELDERRLHEIRGRCISAMNQIDGMLGTFITIRYLEVKSDEAEQQGHLEEWHRLIMSNLATGTRISVFQEILRAQNRLDDATKPLIERVKAANEIRNKIAHSSIDIWPTSGETEELDFHNIQTRVSRKGFESKRLSLEEAIDDMEMMEGVVADLSKFFIRTFTVNDSTSEES